MKRGSCQGMQKPIQMETINRKKKLSIPNAALDEVCTKATDIGIGADELIACEYEAVPCLLEPFLPTEGIGVVAGQSDLGKSTWLRQLCMAIVSGEDKFLGFKLSQDLKRRCIYVSSEDSKYALSKYCKAYANYTLKPKEDFQGLRFLQDSEQITEVLETSLKERPADLVVMDVFTDFYLGKLNEATNVRAFLRDYFNLSARYGCLILFCHHTSKSSKDEGPNKHNLLGSQAIEAKSRVTIELREDPVGNEDKRHMFITKGNYLPAEVKDEGYELTFIDMIFERTNNRTPKFIYENRNPGEQAELEQQIISMQNQGMTQGQIAAQVNRSQGQVSRILKRLQSAENQPF